MRVSYPSPVGLIATHAALVSAVHGVTGTLVGTTDSQTLTNKILSTTSVTVINAGVGADPVLTSNSGSQLLDLAGLLRITLDLHYKSGTAYSGSLAHNISNNRTWAFPDVAGNVIIDADTGKSLSLAQLTIENAGAGADPVFTSDDASQKLTLAGKLHLSGLLLTDGDVEIKSSTAYKVTLYHTISAARNVKFPDVAGTLCMWDAANAAVTRYWSVAAYGLLDLVAYDQERSWIFDTGNDWLDCASTVAHYIKVNLPHGAVITALRVTGQETATAVLTTQLKRAQHSDNSQDILAQVVNTDSMGEVADTSISNATVDNDTYGYIIGVYITNEAAECRLRSIQIDYTVTEPQP